MSFKTIAALAAAIVAWSAQTAFVARAADATDGYAAEKSIDGTVADAVTDAALPGVRLVLTGSAQILRAQTDGDGRFSFRSGLDNRATYVLRAEAPHYVPYVSPPLPAGAGLLSLRVLLRPITTASIATLGHVSVTGTGVPNSSPATLTEISAAQLAMSGAQQVQTALTRVPGVTIEHGSGGAPGNVAFLSIRGAGAFAGGTAAGYEVLVLQDGEPLRYGQAGTYDLSAVTPAIYSRVEVIEGVGGTSLFGANTIGGVVNLVTRDPAASEGGELTGSAGPYGTTDWNLLQTNTIGRIGYLVDLHRYGTSGYIPAGFAALYAPYGGAGDVASPSLTYNLKSALSKFAYRFSGSTTATLTASDESDFRDQLGLTGYPLGGTDAATGLPIFYGFPGDYVWDIAPKYSLGVRTVVGGGELIVRGYTQWLERVVDGLGEPDDLCCHLVRSADRLSGALASWTRPAGASTLTLAVGGNGDSYLTGMAAGAAATFDTLSYTYGKQIERTYLAREELSLSPKFDATFAGYYSDYDTLNVRRFDPRLAVVNKPNANTVFRFSVGTGFAAPRLSDLFSPLNLKKPLPSELCPVTQPNCAAGSGNPNLVPETATGADIGFEQTLAGSGDVSLTLYDTALRRHIFSGFLPAQGGLTFPNGKPVLFISQPMNIAGSIYRGAELSVAAPVSVALGVRAYFDAQSAFPTGVEAATQALLGNVVNGEQYLGTPLHKSGWSVTYRSAAGAQGYLTGDYYGPGNSYNVPAFWTYDAGLSAAIGHTTLRLAWTNVFNANATIFTAFQMGVPYQGLAGYTGTGLCDTVDPTLYCTSAYASAPHALTLTLDYRWGSIH